MNIGERIKQRREQLGMSQDELAQKLGYKTRSSIAKIEHEASNLPQTKIKAIATALDTTPSYIMGWEDEALQPTTDYYIEGIGIVEFTANEREQLLNYAKFLISNR